MGFFSKFSSGKKPSKVAKQKEGFYSYVKSLFPPEYYQPEHEGPNPLDAEENVPFTGPQFVFVHQVSGTRFGVACKYILDIENDTTIIDIVKPATLMSMQTYHAQTAKMYVIVGIGHNPRDLDNFCLIPLYYVKQTMTKGELLKYQRNKKELFGCFMGNLT